METTIKTRLVRTAARAWRGAQAARPACKREHCADGDQDDQSPQSRAERPGERRRPDNAVRPKPAVIWGATRSAVREPSHAIRDGRCDSSVHDDPARHTTARRLERPGIAAIMRGALIALRNRGGLAPGT